MTPKELSEEVWRMLPEDCREVMKNIEKEFKESIEADAEYMVEKELFKRNVYNTQKSHFKIQKSINSKSTE